MSSFDLRLSRVGGKLRLCKGSDEAAAQIGWQSEVVEVPPYIADSGVKKAQSRGVDIRVWIDDRRVFDILEDDRQRRLRDLESLGS